MRIVAVADTHTFEADLGEVPTGDVFVHAGDLLRGGELHELEAVAAWIRALPHEHKIVIAGNHDFCFAHHPEEARAMLGPGVVYLEDAEHVIDGTRFWGSPWQPEFHDWAFNLPRGPALAAKWSLIPAGIDVLVTHGPPAGVGDRGPMGAARLGCADLREAVRRVRPALHVFGHIHQDGGAFDEDGLVYANVTTWECERMPTVLDVDPKTREIVRVSVPPRGA